MWRFRVIIILLLFAGNWRAQSQTVRVRGRVFEDKNGNGLKEPSERLLKSILVSDGKQVVSTNKQGEYIVDTTVGSSIFAITPDDYCYSIAWKNRNTAFLYISRTETFVSDTIEIKHDIGLKKRKVAAAFRIGAIGDVQVKDMQEINYANQTLFAELMHRNDIDFNIFLGDQINDQPELFTHIRQMIELLPMPSWSVLGNHDRNTQNYDFQDNLFNSYFGANHYAFNYGNVHFIVINNVYSEKGVRNYTGLIPNKQLEFIKNDLQYVPKDKIIVLCQHIPMSQTQNREEVLEMFAGRTNLLILSGHTHKVNRQILSDNIQEITVGAACGSWWVGERDWQGVPAATMQCGSPRGYFTLDFSKDGYSLAFKGVSIDLNRQMDIWLNGQDSIDNEIAGLQAIPSNLVVTNIYGGSDSTRVVMSVDGGEWIEMKKTNMPAPMVSRIISLNKEGVFPTKYSRKVPFRRQNSSHIWTAVLSEYLNEGVHSVHVKASDKYGFSIEGFRHIIVQCE